MDIYEYIKKTKNYNLLKDNLTKKEHEYGSFRFNSFLCCKSDICSFEDSGNKGIYIAGNSLNAAKIAEDLRFFSIKNGEDILILEPYEYMLYDVEAKSTELSAMRVEIFYKILCGNWKILVTSPAAIAQWLPNPEYIRESALKLKREM